MILLVLSLGFLFESCASLGKDTQTTAIVADSNKLMASDNGDSSVNISALGSTDNEIALSYFAPKMPMLSEQNKSDIIIPPINDLAIVVIPKEQWAREQKRLNDDLLNYNRFNYWKSEKELKEYYESEPGQRYLQFLYQMEDRRNKVPSYNFKLPDPTLLSEKLNNFPNSPVYR